MTLRILAVLILATLQAGCAAPASPASAGAAPGDRPAGYLLIVGGGHQPDELVARFVELAGGAGTARIAVLPLASGVPETSGPGKVEQLVEFGAEAFVVNPTRQEAESDSIVALFDDVTGIWFTGGDQSRITAALSGTRAAERIRDRYMEGAVLGGTSAGAAIMSDTMLTGEQILAGEDTIGYHGDEFRRIAPGSIHVVPGLGFLAGAIVDQHFIERERHNRLLSVILERPSFIGVGIGESTAIQVNPDGTWDVVGVGSVIVYDARDATVSARDGALGAADVRMHVLPTGSWFDPGGRTARLPGSGG